MKASYSKLLATAAVTILMCAVAPAQSIKGSIALSGLPERVAVNYLTNKVYVALPSFGGPTDSLAVIDGNTDTVTSTITIPPVGFEVAVDVFSNRIYVAGCFQQADGTTACSVAVVDGYRNKVVRTIPITTTPGNGIQGIAINLVTSTVYVANGSDNEIDVIRLGARRVSAKIPLNGNSPYGLTVNPLRDELYVTLGTNEVYLISGVTNTITGTATAGTTDVTAAVNLLTGNVFIPDNVFGQSNVNVLSSTGSLLATVPVGNTPFGVDVDPITNLAFVTNTQDGTLSILDGSTNTVKSILPVLGTFVAINPFTEKVYVSGQDNSLTVVNEK